MNPNGVASHSPGLARGTSAYPGFTGENDPNPNGVATACELAEAPELTRVAGTPLGFVLRRTQTQGRRSFLAPTLGWMAQPRWGSSLCEPRNIPLLITPCFEGVIKTYCD